MATAQLQVGTEPASRRIASLDQFRGYTVAGMLVVNFLGGYAWIARDLPVLEHHNTYCSYADTIMPQFFFAVGYAYRLTLLKRLRRQGWRPAYGHVVSRSLGLMLIGFIVYQLDGGAGSWEELKGMGLSGFLEAAFQRSWFQTLTHIALTSLWIMPVIAAGTAARLAFAAGSAALHLWLSDLFFFDWAMGRPVIDGGQLAFLSWATPMLLGSIAYDLMVSRGPRGALRPLIGWALLLMAIGYGLSCLGGGEASDGSPRRGWAAAPFFPPEIETNLWTMSQRSGSVSYLTFAAGFSAAVFALFVVLGDLGPMRVGMFRTFGRNALAAYVLHPLVFSAVKPYVPKDAPGWYAAAGFGIAFAITYLLVRHLEKNEIYLKL
jgi:predicted acyltransferase